MKLLIITIHSVSPAKEVTSTAEKKRDSNGLSPREANGLSPPSESNEIFRFYNLAKMLTVLMWIVVVVITMNSQWIEMWLLQKGNSKMVKSSNRKLPSCTK